MKKLFWIISAALLAVTACHTEAPDNDPVGIAMIVKNGQIDYFRPHHHYLFNLQRRHYWKGQLDLQRL